MTQYIDNSSPLAYVSDAVFQTKLTTIFHVYNLKLYYCRTSFCPQVIYLLYGVASKAVTSC